MQTPPRPREAPRIPGAPPRKKRKNKNRQDEHENSKRQNELEGQIQIAAGTKREEPGLLRNNEPERPPPYHPMIDYILGRVRQDERRRGRRREDETSDPNQRPDETDDTYDPNQGPDNTRPDGLIVNNLKF